MDEKRSLAHELDEIQQELKELEIRYEQYFAGIERREPYNERKIWPAGCAILPIAISSGPI